MKNPPVFGSKKATFAAVGAAAVSLIMTILPLIFPAVPAEVWSRLAELLTAIVAVYLAGQSAVDVMGKYKTIDGQSQLDIAPENND